MANLNTIPRTIQKIKVVTNNTTEECENAIKKNCYKIIANWIKRDLAAKKKGYN